MASGNEVRNAVKKVAPVIHTLETLQVDAWKLAPGRYEMRLKDNRRVRVMFDKDTNSYFASIVGQAVIRETIGKNKGNPKQFASLLDVAKHLLVKANKASDVSAEDFLAGRGYEGVIDKK